MTKVNRLRDGTLSSGETTSPKSDPVENFMDEVGGTSILDGTTPSGKTTSSSGTTPSDETTSLCNLRPCGSGSGSGDSSNQNQPIECNISDNKITENDPCFQKLVREIMSKKFFEIPENDSEPLSWDW